MLPVAFVEKLKTTLEQALIDLSGMQSINNRTSNTPQKVTDFMDYNFGKYLGVIIGNYDSYFISQYGRKMNDEEYEEFMTYIIDYQDDLAKLFYALK